jgi:hypothetical protein
MQVAHITPTPMLLDVLGPLETYHLCLTDLVLRDEVYTDFYRKRVEAGGNWVILDNDAFENRSRVPVLDRLIAAAQLLRPSEVILPDVIGGTAAENVRLAKEGARALQKYPHLRGTRFMAVPQGRTVEEFLECADGMARIDEVGTFGIGYGATKHLETSRGRLLKLIALKYPHHRYHLLGCYPDMSDFSDPEVNKIARGLDTCKFVRYGLSLLTPTFENPIPYPGRGPEYFQRVVESPTQLECIRENIVYWRTQAQKTVIPA